MGSPSAIISSISFFPMLYRAFATRSRLQLQENSTGIVERSSISIPSRRMPRICSGLFPSSRSFVTEWMRLKFASSFSMTFSSAKGMSWTMKPPACFTVLFFSIRTPSPTEEGTCSDAAKYQVRSSAISPVCRSVWPT